MGPAPWKRDFTEAYRDIDWAWVEKWRTYPLVLRLGPLVVFIVVTAYLVYVSVFFIRESMHSQAAVVVVPVALFALASVLLTIVFPIMITAFSHCHALLFSCRSPERDAQRRLDANIVSWPQNTIVASIVRALGSISRLLIPPAVLFGGVYFVVKSGGFSLDLFLGPSARSYERLTGDLSGIALESPEAVALAVTATQSFTNQIVARVNLAVAAITVLAALGGAIQPWIFRRHRERVAILKTPTRRRTRLHRVEYKDKWCALIEKGEVDEVENGTWGKTVLEWEPIESVLPRCFFPFGARAWARYVRRRVSIAAFGVVTAFVLFHSVLDTFVIRTFAGIGKQLEATISDNNAMGRTGDTSDLKSSLVQLEALRAQIQTAQWALWFAMAAAGAAIITTWLFWARRERPEVLFQHGGVVRMGLLLNFDHDGKRWVAFISSRIGLQRRLLIVPLDKVKTVG